MLLLATTCGFAKLKRYLPLFLPLNSCLTSCLQDWHKIVHFLGPYADLSTSVIRTA